MAVKNLSENSVFDTLIKNLKSYHPDDGFSVVYKAYKIAREAHKNQFRKTGEPYIIHPWRVAISLSSMNSDLESIAAGLLHDVIEDTSYTYQDIKNLFGEEIANIVDGVTKLDKIKYVSQEESQAENYRKMFLAMAQDIRVVLVKIADRLHNMETLKCLRPDKQKRIAQETLDIYAPITHRLGMSLIRYQLEDLCFYYLYPEEYKYLSRKIRLKRNEREKYIEKIIEQIKLNLKKYNIKADVSGRPKHFFSIYKKMVYKKKSFDQIYDLFAVRVIVAKVQECYAVLGIIHDMYKPIPGRFKDYIAIPKSNMYQSLHSTLIGPEGEAFEIQIRTHQMHKIAEYGIAAHWKYKSGAFDKKNKKNSTAEKLAWLKQILEWQREYNNNKDYLDAVKLDLSVYQSHVYCFTPQGKIISLLSGSTPIDFAYAIHSDVGNKMVGARVNGKLMQLNYILKNGDRVEVITSKNSTGPKLSWLKMIKTNRAKHKINQWFKSVNKIENVAKGKELLEKEAKNKNVSLNDLIDEEIEKKIIEKYNFDTIESFFAAIGYGTIKKENIINKLYSDYKIKNKIFDDLKEKNIALNENKKSGAIIVKGIGDTNIRFSQCCNPVPGDEIIAFITRGRGVSLHRKNCKNIIKLGEENKKRLLEAQWQSKISNMTCYVKLKLVCDDIVGILSKITKIFCEEKIKIQAINSYNKYGKIVFDIGFEIENTIRLNNLCIKLSEIQNVNEVICDNINN